MIPATGWILLAILGLLAGCVALVRHERGARRAVEAALRRSDAMSRSTLEALVHAALTLDTSGAIISANGSAHRLFGYEGGDLAGRSIDELIVPENGAPGLAAYLRSLPTQFQERGRAVDAQRHDATQFRARISIGDHGVGAERLFTVTVRDLAQSTEIGALHASEARLREITDAVPVLIAYVDAEGRFGFHNKAYAEALGVEAQKLEGRTLLEVFGAERYQAMHARVEEVMAGAPVRFERAWLNAQGEMRDYAEHYFPHYGLDADHGKALGFYSITTDITEMKRVNRMKSEFVSMVSHELRTPLTSIRGSLGLIAGGVAGTMPDAAMNLVDIAKNNCERLIRLINDILDSEKIESGKMHFDLQVLEIQPILAQAIAANEGFAAQHGVSLRLLAGGEGVRVHVDGDGLTQVVTNLLSNAARFSPKGACVDVSIARAMGRVRVAVRDLGPGIPEEFRARIFQKFSQADTSDSRQKSGTGLGLNISKAIVEQLGGTIGFTTESGAGTTFFFELPEWREAPVSAFMAGSPAAKRPCVLVCEDDHDIARLIGMMLDRAGYDTDLAYTAARARELAPAGQYVAMTVDLKLPDQDGIALMRVLRQDDLTRHLPIVVVSAIAEAGRIRLNSESLSVSDWLGKPIDANRLVVAIRDAVADRAQERPRILHVEDDPDIQHISAAIARDFATFDFAATVEEARARLKLRKYDLVLLDLNLPEGVGTGWSLVPAIEALVPSPPIVVFSAGDVSRADGARIAAVLVKARTTDEEFLETIQRVLARGAGHPREPRKSVMPKPLEPVAPLTSGETA